MTSTSIWQLLVLAVCAFAATVPADAIYTRSGQTCYTARSVVAGKALPVGGVADTTNLAFSTQVLWVPTMINNRSVSPSDAMQLGYAWQAEAVSKLGLMDAMCKTFHNASCTTAQGMKFHRIAVGVAGSVTGNATAIESAVQEFQHKTHQLSISEVSESRNLFAGAEPCKKCTNTAGLCSKAVWGAFLDAATPKPACVTVAPLPFR